ncbi:hypothetical protein MSMEI_1043 [Mycolicibacterium smegmatis MC2 155]|uniref:Uncharacterized protein n=1 Tax=Mycolicibacterium smegmatis (strain ATCC 700084 / mc(2)155) TaxID=246196 RepID=I7FF76_MYCS2|nr:hypothetical protein MSMEI_1043 [Mycolicibacterium smegmatis MC2 155]
MRRFLDLAVLLARRLAEGLHRNARTGDLQLRGVGALLVLQHLGDRVVLRLLVLAQEVLAGGVTAGDRWGATDDHEAGHQPREQHACCALHRSPFCPLMRDTHHCAGFIPFVGTDETSALQSSK